MLERLLAGIKQSNVVSQKRGTTPDLYQTVVGIRRKNPNQKIRWYNLIVKSKGMSPSQLFYAILLSVRAHQSAIV